jgi:hypothetical protein
VACDFGKICWIISENELNERYLILVASSAKHLASGETGESPVLSRNGIRKRLS